MNFFTPTNRGDFFVKEKNLNMFDKLINSYYYNINRPLYESMIHRVNYKEVKNIS